MRVRSPSRKPSEAGRAFTPITIPGVWKKAIAIIPVLSAQDGGGRGGVWARGVPFLGGDGSSPPNPECSTTATLGAGMVSGEIWAGSLQWASWPAGTTGRNKIDPPYVGRNIKIYSIRSFSVEVTESIFYPSSLDFADFARARGRGGILVRHSASSIRARTMVAFLRRPGVFCVQV